MEQAKSKSWIDGESIAGYESQARYMAYPDLQASIDSIRADMPTTRFRPNYKILDIGAGNGKFSVRLLRDNPAIDSVTNMDPSPEMCDAALEYARAENLLHRIGVTKTFDHLDDARFHACTSHRLMNALPNDQSVKDHFAKVSQVLLPGGFYHLSIFNLKKDSPEALDHKFVFRKNGVSVKSADLTDGTEWDAKMDYGPGPAHTITSIYYSEPHITDIAACHRLHYVRTTYLERFDSQGVPRTPLLHLCYQKGY